MAKVTPKENFMMLRHGGTPAYVPFYSLAGIPYKGESAIGNMPLSFFQSNQFQAGGKDMWGVPYAKPAEGGIDAAMPDTSVVTLEDISDWTKVVQFPKPMDIDVEKVYADFVKKFDRSQTALKMSVPFQPFQTLVGLMGFEGGLCALYTDPDEVKAMLNAMVELVAPLYDKAIDIIKPDCIGLTDDTAAAATPFFSPEIYKEIFYPVYARMSKAAQERDIPVVFHNCGMMQEFLPFMVDFGVEFTEPAQTVMPILELKEQYKGKVSFMGCWGWADHIPATFPEFDEEEFRQDIRDTIDKYSVGGGYAFAGWPVGLPNQQEAVARITEVLRDEAHWYGRKVYGYVDD